MAIRNGVRAAAAFAFTLLPAALAFAQAFNPYAPGAPALLRVFKPEMVPVERKTDLPALPFEQEQLTPEIVKALDEMLFEWRPLTIGSIIITGHADRTESPKGSQQLSERRAVVVRDYLVEKGIDVKLIFWQGHGAREPAAGAAQCAERMERRKLSECLAPNRRVTVEVVAMIVKPPRKPPPRDMGV